MAVSIGSFSAAQAYQRASLGARDAAQARAGVAAEKPSAAGSAEELSEEEKKQVSDLRKRDAEVRAHENAHAATGGGHAGSPSYEMQRGPDGKSYAVGGEVAIDTSAESTPEATARKMEVVIRAALAPADPSPQDQRVAAAARQMRVEAQSQAREQREAERTGEGEDAAAETDAAGEADAAQETGEIPGAVAAADAADEAAARDASGDASFAASSGDAAGTGSPGAPQARQSVRAVPPQQGVFGAVPVDTGAPIFSGAGDLVGFNEDSREDRGGDAEQADLRLAAARAYGGASPSDGVAALFEALGRL